MGRWFQNSREWGYLQPSQEAQQTSFTIERRSGRIRPEVSIRPDTENRDVFINTDRGRIMRPLLVLEDGTLNLAKFHLEGLKTGEITFSDLVSSGA